MKKHWRFPLALLLGGLCASCDSGSSTQYIVEVWIDTHQYTMSQHTKVENAANGLLVQASDDGGSGARIMVIAPTETHGSHDCVNGASVAFTDPTGKVYATEIGDLDCFYVGDEEHDGDDNINVDFDVTLRASTGETLPASGFIAVYPYGG